MPGMESKGSTTGEEIAEILGVLIPVIFVELRMV